MKTSNSTQDDTFESLLQLALTDIANEENKTLLCDDTFKNATLPKEYDTKMQRYLKKIQFKTLASRFIGISFKIGCAILMILGFSFLLLLQNKTVRASCQKTILEFYNKFVKISSKEDLSGKEDVVQSIDLPQGFYLVDSFSTESNTYHYYQNNNNDTIEIFRFNKKNVSTFDNEHYVIDSYMLDGNEFVFYESTDVNFSNILYWHTNSWYFEIHSNLNKKEMEKIAKSLLDM